MLKLEQSAQKMPAATQQSQSFITFLNDSIFADCSREKWMNGVTGQQFTLASLCVANINLFQELMEGMSL